jgi:hypothetical protein
MSRKLFWRRHAGALLLVGHSSCTGTWRLIYTYTPRWKNTPANVTNCYVLQSSASNSVNVNVGILPRGIFVFLWWSTRTVAWDGTPRWWVSRSKCNVRRHKGNWDEHHLYEAKTNKFDDESVVVTSLWLFVIFVVYVINIFSGDVDVCCCSDRHCVQHDMFLLLTWCAECIGLYYSIFWGRKLVWR